MTQLSAPVRSTQGSVNPGVMSRLMPARGWITTAAIALVYVGVAVIANWPAWSQGVSHSLQTSGATDVQEEVWFLAQTPWAIIHGLNPFGNGLLNAPVGINLMDNTSMLILGLIGTPITLLLGPLATFNILLDFAFASSAFAFYLMVRRFVSWAPAAFLGGLLYGFSPFAIAEGTGHLFLVFNPVPPLIIVVLDRTLRTRQSSPLSGGILLGLCLIAQLYISSEMFASLVVMIAIAVGLYVGYWLSARPDFDYRRLVRFAVVAGLVSVLGIGYGAWMALVGPNHISGPAQSPVALAGVSEDPVGWVVPTVNQRFNAGLAGVGDPLVADRAADWHVIVDSTGENGSYIGIPLLLLLVVGALVLRRRRLVQALAAMAIAALILSLGSHLHLDGRLTPVRLPFLVLAHLPLFDSSVAARYALFFWLFAALIFAIVLESVRTFFARGSGVGLAPLAGVMSCALAGMALLPLVPAWPYSATRWSSPAWFLHAGRSLPAGSTVLVYPMASPGDSSAMIWQAEAHMDFKMPGGYAVFRSASGPGTFVPAVSPLQTAMALCTEGRELPLTGPAMRSLLVSWKIGYVVVPLSAPHQSCAESLFSRALGPATITEGVAFWRVGA